MSKFMELCMGVTPVEEGWGVALTRLGIIAGVAGVTAKAAMHIGMTTGKFVAKHNPVFALAAGGVVGAAAGALGAGAVVGGYKASSAATKKLTADMFDAILKNQKLKNYIQKHCDALYKQTKKIYPSISTNINLNSQVTTAKINQAVDKSVTFGEALKNQYASSSNVDGKPLKIGKYTIEILFDSDSIHAMLVVFSINDKTLDFIAKRIPAPTGSELSYMFEN